ncbi:MAG: hypothetical protein IPK97_03830 [Ahniella sp.]|nr:hypothetical protein [Ahniella sp.]
MKTELLPDCPPLRPEVVIAPFESGDGQERHLVAIDHHHFVVDRATAVLLAHLRDPASAAQVAIEVSAQLGTTIDTERVRALVDHELPRALFVSQDTPQKSPLSWQRLLFTQGMLDPLTRLASPLFRLPIAMVLMLSVLAIDLMVLARHLGEPPIASAGGGASWLLVLALTLAGVLIHELGHVSALNRFGRQSGGIGFGVYFIFPTFFADVSTAWRLTPGQRAVVDVGGLYLQGLYMGAMGIWALMASDPTVPMKVMWLSHFLMLYTLNPSLKFDGYWLISDLTRTSNLHDRVLDTARKVASRCLGRSESIGAERRDLHMLAWFTAAATAYFGYLLVSLGMGLARSIRTATLEDSSHTWLHWIPDLLIIGLLLVILTMVARRCLRTLVSVFAAPTAEART